MASHHGMHGTGTPVTIIATPTPTTPAGPALAADAYARANHRAELALARLAGVAGLVPSVDWLLYGALRKEALLSSQIEGSRATLRDLFSDEAGQVLANPADVEQITNHLRAFRLVRDKLRSAAGPAISLRLLCDAHRLLLDGARGAGKRPGELRHSQIEMALPGHLNPLGRRAVPPPPEQLPVLLADLERFIHDPAPVLPPLVRVALVHAQFETIQPFAAGNGHIGRLLIAALLEQWRLLPEPLVCLSGYLKRHQADYNRRLAAVRSEGDWAGWVGFFLDGVEAAATEAERGIVALARLINADRKRVLAAPRMGALALRLFELLPLMPHFTIEQARQKLQTSFPSANLAAKLLQHMGLLSELTGQKKNRLFSYVAYVELLTGGV